MKNLITILLFLLLPFLSIAQEQSVKKPTQKENTNFKNQIDLDFEVLAFSFGYKRRVNKSWFVGANIGLGIPISLVYATGGRHKGRLAVGPTEFLHISLVAKKQRNRSKWSYEIEPRYGFSGTDDGVLFYNWSIGAGIFFGRKAQLGVRTFRVWSFEGSRNAAYISNSIILRINTKW